MIQTFWIVLINGASLIFFLQKTKVLLAYLCIPCEPNNVYRNKPYISVFKFFGCCCLKNKDKNPRTFNLGLNLNPPSSWSWCEHISSIDSHSGKMLTYPAATTYNYKGYNIIRWIDFFNGSVAVISQSLCFV